MFKGAKGDTVDERLRDNRRSRGFLSWLTVTMGPKGSYREHDVLTLLFRHLEHWREGRHWRIVLADDCAAHKTDNVLTSAWSRGQLFLSMEAERLP